MLPTLFQLPTHLPPSPQAWRARLDERRIKMARLQAAAATWRNCRLRAGWAAWQAFAAARRQQRALLQHAVQAMLGFRRRVAWAAWQAFVATQHEAASRMQAAIQLWQHAQLHKAFRWGGGKQPAIHVACPQAVMRPRAPFDCLPSPHLGPCRTWRERHEAWRTGSDKLQRAAAVFAHRHLAAAWRAWAAFAAERRERRALLAAAAARLRHRELAAAWHGWRQGMWERQQKATKLAAAVQRWQQGALRAAWRGWREGAARQQAKQQRLAAAVELWRRCRLRAAWAAWTAHVTFRRHARSVLARFSQQALARGWRAWVEYAEQRRAARERLAAVVAHWQRAALAKAWQVRVGRARDCLLGTEGGPASAVCTASSPTHFSSSTPRPAGLAPGRRPPASQGGPPDGGCPALAPAAAGRGVCRVARRGAGAPGAGQPHAGRGGALAACRARLRLQPVELSGEGVQGRQGRLEAQAARVPGVQSALEEAMPARPEAPSPHHLCARCGRARRCSRWPPSSGSEPPPRRSRWAALSVG